MKYLAFNPGRRFAWALLLALTLGLPAPARSQAGIHFAMAAGKTSSTLPFEMIDNRVFVEVRLNGRGPFHFVLDTGAGGFSVVESVARELGLKIEDAREGQGVGEKRVRDGRTQISRMQVGDLELTNLEFEVLRASDSGQVFGTKPLDGVFGLELFRHVVVKHDYVHKTLTFTLPDKYDYKGSGAIVHFELAAQIPLVEAELDGVRGTFGVDTGARSSLLLYGPFTEQNKLKEKYDAKLEGVTGWGIGGPVRSLLGRAKELKIGEVSVHDIVIRLSTQKAGSTTASTKAGLIGPDVLSQFDVTFDYPRSRIIFEKNADYGRRDGYDRAGVWMGQSGKHFAAVDVIAGGPAAEAGLKQGDSILAIDGVDTEKLILPDVRERVRREAPGKNLTLLVDSNGKERTVTITLRDLV
jgi:gag-polyprotein putative aspartyl protease/PDZ domain/Aspartyl protease